MKAMKLMSLLLLAALGLFFTACEDDENESALFEFKYDFSTTPNGWTGDFADYPVGEEAFYELSFAHQNLPAPLDTTKKALRIHGSNRSDDLFMFTKKKLTGLAPNTEYTVDFEFEMASNLPISSIGIGGGPGTATYVKVGASAAEPKKVARNDFYEFNLDKGNQAQSGDDAIVVGTLGITGDDFAYTLIKRSNDEQTFKAKTDGEGNLWVFVGVDSGFEGIHTFYITKASIRLR
ncbi:MAG: hypothetical protein ACK4TA_00395 [Saprospiraceae bacterium]